MKKLIISAILGIFFAAVMSIAASAEVTYDFNETTGKLTISGSGEITQPDVADAINNDNYALKTVEITGTGITSIGVNAFANCNCLTSINIPSSVTSIGEGAFQQCRSLSSITIPDGVTSISDVVFAGCMNLSSITIPASVQTIGGEYVFFNCPNLTTVYYGGTPEQWGALPLPSLLPNARNVVCTMASSTVVTLDPETAEYDGSDHKPTVTAVKKGNTTLTPDTEYTVSYSADEFIEPGTYTITITGKSPYSGTCTAEFKVTGIKITTTALPNGTVNNAYSQTLTCTGGTGAKTWEVVESSLPAGLTLNAETGRISGTPTTPGTYTFNVIVTDSETKIDIKQLTITISPQKYTIAIHNDGNGAVYASETSAKAGTLIKLTVIPKPGFVLRSLEHTYEDIIMTNGTFIMPAHDVIFTAVFETGNNNNYNVKPVPKPDPEILPASGVAIPLNFRATSTQNGNTARLRWSNFPNADTYTLYLKKNGTKTKLKTTTKNSIKVTGLKNNTTYEFEVAANVGTWSSANTIMAQITVDSYYKPAPKAEVKYNSVELSWRKVPLAEKYIVYYYENGKLREVAISTGTKALMVGLEFGKEYTYAVTAIVNGQETSLKKSDLVTVKL